jgi:hypothetical protein
MFRKMKFTNLRPDPRKRAPVKDMPIKPIIPHRKEDPPKQEDSTEEAIPPIEEPPKQDEPEPAKVPTIEVVVARYSEKLDWIDHIPHTVTVYNKGNDDIDKFPRTLPNVGREGHTYYVHICNNYDHLADYTVFLQGNPLDHSSDILHQLLCLPEKPFHELSSYVLTQPKTVHPHMIDTYTRIFGNECPEYFTFGAGAQFCVSKEQILKRPKEFYANIVEILSHSICPPEGYDVERLHPLVFGL